MEQVSNYTAVSSKQVLKIALLFSENKFVKQNKTLTLVTQEVNTALSLTCGLLARRSYCPQAIIFRLSQ